MYGTELVLFPDVVLEVCSHLAGALAAREEDYCADVLVANALPATSPRPFRAVTVRSDGGRRASAVHRVERIGVNVWAANEQQAADLARMVSALLMGTPAPVDHVAELSAFAEVPDESQQPHRYGTFAVTVSPVAE